MIERFDRQLTLPGFPADAQIVALAEGIDESSTRRWLQEATIALDCRHNFPERFLLNELCVRTGVPYVFAAMNAGEGHVTVVRPGRTACLRCLFEEGDPTWEPLGFPVLGAVAGTVGTLAALEAVKVLSGWGLALYGRLLVMDLSDATFRTYPTQPDPACPVCGDRQQPRDQVLAGATCEMNNTTPQRRQRP